MSRFLSDTSPVERVAVLSDAGSAWTLVQTSTLLHTVDATPQAAANAFADQVQTCRQDMLTHAGGQTAAVPTLWVLSSFCLNTWIQPHAYGIQSLSELERLIVARAVQLYGPAPDGQPWAVCADWKSNGPFLCHAAPQSTLAATERDSVQSPVTLALHASKRHPELQSEPRLTWMTFTLPGETHVFAFSRGYPVSIASRRSSNTATTQESLNQALALWRIEMARTGEMAERLYWLDGDMKPPANPADLPPAVSRLRAPWHNPTKASVDLAHSERWLTWVIGLLGATT